MAFARIKSKLTATALVSTLAIVPVGAGVIAITQPARAQSETAQPTPPPGPKDGPKAERDRDGMGRGGHDWKNDRFARHHRRHHRHGNHAMRLAKKLAGVETAIGIRSDQLDAWRRFTSLLVAFASPPQWPDVSMAEPDDEDTDSDTSMMPDQTMGDEGAGSDATTSPAPTDDTAGTAGTADTDTGGDTSSFGPLNFMVDRAIDRGEKAKELKDAMAKLDAVLTPGQKRAARMLMRHHRHGMRGHGRWGHHGSWDRDDGRGDRDNRHGRM